MSFCYCPKCGYKCIDEKEVITKVTINVKIYCKKCDKYFAISMLKTMAG